MPSAMHGILDAPVPFLVGLERSYLDSTPPEKRPAGVVFVDLDQDQVLLGVEEGDGLMRESCFLFVSL